MPIAAPRDLRQELRDAFMDSTSSPLSVSLGEFYLSLIEDWSWISRRVETIEFVDLEQRQRHVSVDIIVSELRKRSADFGLGDYTEVPIPIALLPKGLMLDFDVRSQTGASISIFNRDQDSRLAMLAMLSLVKGTPSLKFESQTAAIKADVERGLNEVAHVFLEPPEEDSLLKSGQLIEPSSLRAAAAKSRTYWARVVQVEAVRRLVREFSLNFAPVIWFNLDGSNEIFKYRRIENERDAQQLDLLPGKDSAEWRIPDPAWPVVIRLSDVGRAAREHFRVTAPGGTFFGATLLLALPTSKRVGYSERLTTERSVLYTSITDTGDYFVVGFLYPDLEGFGLPAVLLAGTTCFFLWTGGILQLTPIHGLELLQAQTDAAVTLLLLVPTIFIAFLVRDGEHHIRRWLLRKDRARTLSFTLIPLVVGVASLFAKFSGYGFWYGVLWIALGTLPFVIGAWLLRGWVRLEGFRQSVLRRSTRTVSHSYTV